MSSIVDKRLDEYAHPFDQPSGFSSKPRDMKRMSDRASANSYHSPAPPHAKTDGHGENHVGGTFMPGVQRRES